MIVYLENSKSPCKSTIRIRKFRKLTRSQMNLIYTDNIQLEIEMERTRNLLTIATKSMKYQGRNFIMKNCKNILKPY